MKIENLDTDTTPSSMSQIQSFFKDKSIFITGATGFLGHVLLSKLLKSCSDLKEIFVLLREKRGKTAIDRFNEMLEDEVFEIIKTECPDTLRKVRPIVGDCLESGLGLSVDDRNLIKDRVNVIFHVAATVRFDAPLRQAVHMNVRSTCELLDLAHEMKDLKAFVHVSTAYSNCTGRKEIEEKFYDSPLSYDQLINLVDTLDEETLEKITPGLLGNYPNTYVYTKAIAENVCQLKGADLPLVLFRPAIVISAVKEPIPGWINNVYGPIGVVAAVAVGLMRTMHCNGNMRANLVPCDYVVNAAIASAWSIGTGHDKKDTEVQHSNGHIPNGMADTEIQHSNGHIPNGNAVTEVQQHSNGHIPNGNAPAKITNGNIVHNGKPVSNGTISNGTGCNGYTDTEKIPNGDTAKHLATNGSLKNGNVTNGIVSNGVSNGIACNATSNGCIPNGNNNKIEKTDTSNVKIYNYSSDSLKKFTWNDFIEGTTALRPILPSTQAIWAPFVIVCKYKPIYHLCCLLLHLFPAFIVDSAAKLLGRKPKLLDAYSKIHKLSDVLEYFSTRQWKMKNDNVLNLWNDLPQLDKEMFQFNLTDIKWDDYFYVLGYGIRRFILKENPSTIPEAKRRRMLLLFIHYAMLSAMAAVSFYVCHKLNFRPFNYLM